jgi:ribosomal-protein-alanine N-acetyltransferase
MAVQMTSERLLLRRMASEDALPLHRILSDPEAMLFWSTLPHDSLAMTEAWVAATIDAVAAGEADDFVILLDGTVIGKAGLWNGREIGVLLARECWGRGYAEEALRAIIDRAFGQDHAEIIADIDPRNAASLKLFERLGFRQTGSAKATFLLGGVWADSVYFTLTPEDRVSKPKPRQSDGPTRGWSI